MNKNLEKLNQILELIKSNTVTPNDLRDFLSIILDFNKKSKESIEKLSEENLKTLADGIRYLEREHAKLLTEVETKSERTVKDIEKKISQIADILAEVKAMKLQKPRDGKDGEDGKDGKDGSPDTGEDIVDKINALPINEANQIDASHIKNLPETKGGKGGSTARNLWQLQDYPLTTKGDIMTYDTAAARLPVGEDGQVLVADSDEATGLRWSDPAQLSTMTYMLSGTASGVGSYYEMPSLGSYVAGALADISTAGVSTTPTLLGSFITDTGAPGVTTLPVGIVHFHYETEKVAGSNNYYTYVELYKRTSGGTETLLLTSDNSTQSAVNTTIQQHVDAFNSSVIALDVTDRLVIKIYGVMLSATATIHLYFDDNTDARMELPSNAVDASMFVPYTGAIADLDMGTHGVKSESLRGNGETVLGSDSSDVVLQSATGLIKLRDVTGTIHGIFDMLALTTDRTYTLPDEDLSFVGLTNAQTLTNKTIGNTNTIDVLDSLFTLSDNADSTKKAVFQVSGISTGTTRTYTLPNASATIVVNSSNQTLSGQMTFSASTNSFGTGTATGTQSFASGATISGATKTVNIGTGGVSGSTTAITIGSSTGGATNTVASYGTWTHNGTFALGSNSITMTGSLAATGARVTKGWFTDIESTNMPTVGGTPILTSLTAPQFTTIELGHATDSTISRISAGVLAIEGNNIVTNTSSPTLATITTTGNIELGNASDTTLSRSSAGVLAVEGVVIPSISSTNTLTNKRITKRVGSTTSSATPTINTDDYDCYKITALATAITSFTTNLSGTPTDFQELTIRIKDDGTARAITWGASFANHGAILPTTTTISKTLTVKFIYDSVAAIWGCVSAVEEA